MHEFRTAIANGAPRSRRDPVARKERDRRQAAEPTLVDIAIPRVERRKTNQRGEDRFVNVVEYATIIFRRKKLRVRILNVSGSGVMIETDIMPRIGEVLGIDFENFDRLKAVVRWIRKGRIGLDVGEGAIDLG